MYGISAVDEEQIHVNTTSIRASTWRFSQALAPSQQMIVAPTTTEMRVPVHLLHRLHLYLLLPSLDVYLMFFLLLFCAPFPKEPAIILPVQNNNNNRSCTKESSVMIIS